MNNRIERAMELLKGYSYFITGTAVLNEINSSIAAKDVDVQVSKHDYDAICEMIKKIPDTTIVDGTEKSKSHTEFKIGDELWIDIISDENFNYLKNDMDVLRVAINEKGEFVNLDTARREGIMNREIFAMKGSGDPFMDLGRIAKYIDKGFKIDEDLVKYFKRKFVESLNTDGIATLHYNSASILKSEITMKVITAHTNGVVQANMRANNGSSDNRYDGLSGGIKTIKNHAETFGRLITT